METEIHNPFHNKSIESIGRCAPNHSESLKDAELRTLAGIRFLVGVDVQDVSYREGLEVGIALDDMAQISVFANFEDMCARMKKARLPIGDGQTV